MGQTVYVDLFFLINFSMDFLCLFLTAKILNRRLSVGRALLGAALGGLYADLALFLPFGRLSSLLLDSAVCALMCVAVFYRRKEKSSLALVILVFIAVSMALGGFMTALFHLFNRSSLFQGSESVAGDGISVWVFALLALISGAITLLGGRFFRARSECREAEIEVCYEGRVARLHAMTDSGNLLRDPMSGRPCIVVDVDALAPMLPSEIVHMVHLGDVGAIGCIGTRHAKNLRLLPTHTASGQGMLLGLRMERITVDSGKGAREVDALVALAELGNRADGTNALLPSSLLVG